MTTDDEYRIEKYGPSGLFYKEGDHAVLIGCDIGRHDEWFYFLRDLTWYLPFKKGPLSAEKERQVQQRVLAWLRGNLGAKGVRYNTDIGK